MRVPHRQGIVKCQTDSHGKPDFLHFGDTGFVDLIVSPITTLLTFASGPNDYLVEEQVTVRKAWDLTALNNTNKSAWLYVEIDQVSGKRLFGYTTVKPVFGPTTPHLLKPNLHWFNTTTNQMMVLNDTQTVWSPKLRVFVGSIDSNRILSCQPVGSQVGLTGEYRAGFILFDADGRPLKQWRRDNLGSFYTTESVIATQQSRIANLRLDASLIAYEAVDNIPAWAAVSLSPEFKGKVRLASSRNQKTDVLGIVSYDVPLGEMANILHSGPVSNRNWDWQQPPGTPLFIDETGTLTTDVPQVGAIQRVGYIVDQDTIFLQIHPRINLFNA